MNAVDTAIIVIVVLSMIVSLFRGFVREVLSLVAWFAALWAACTFTSRVSALFESSVSVAGIRLAIAFIFILVATLLAFGIANFIIGRLLEKTGLSGPDRLLGAVFGCVRGAAIVAILVMIAGLTPLPTQPWWQSARMLPAFESAALAAVALLPPDLGRHFRY
jgi:membrane protein required for colicin V production